MAARSNKNWAEGNTMNSTYKGGEGMNATLTTIDGSEKQSRFEPTMVRFKLML